MVAFRPDAPVARRLEVLRRHRLNAVAAPSPNLARVEAAPEAALDDDEAQRVELAALASLRRDPAVRVAEPDYVVHAAGMPTDPRFRELWGMHNTGQDSGKADADIDAPEAWDKTGGSDVIVAVIDTGVDYNHPDLSANILRDANGKVVGWDYANDDADPMDDDSHGTHVAGTIGAVGGNGIGVVGVCPRVRIMPLKFLDATGSGSTSDAIKCIDFAIARGAKVLNNSWGGGDASQLLKEAIQRARAAGVLFVAAAGNETNNNDDSPSYPGSYNAQLDNVLSVAASDHNDRLASFSNYGARTVDLAAPGVDILSTTPNSGYQSFNGTSMATPMVSGAAALLLSRYPSLTVPQLTARLLSNTDHPASLAGKVANGRLNVDQALVEDTTAPGAPAALTATHRSATALRLTWTASGDDGGSGTAARYELRYATAPITEATFAGAAAVPAGELPQPAASGVTQSLILSGLQPGAGYYVALRALDRVGNVSPLVTLGPVATLTSAPVITPFTDEVEGAPLFSGTSPWAVTTEASSSPAHSYTDSPGAGYRNGTNAALTQNASVSLIGFAPTLTFRARTALEADFDFLYVEISTDGGATWARQGLSLTGSAPWSSYRVSLARYYGQSVRVRFRIVTDPQVVNDGVWLDSIRITGDQLQEIGGSAPAAPASLRAAVSGSQIALSWTDASTNETGFAVERRTAASSYSPLATLPAGSTGYTDSAVQPAVTYTYRVRATSGAGDSPYSNEASAVVPVQPPGAPTGLTAVAGDGRVSLSWSAVSGAKGYRVKRSTTSRSGYVTVASTSGAGYIDSGVSNGTSYYYVVTAVNDGGESGNSNEATARPQSVSAGPAAPTGLTAEAGRKKVVLRWSQSASPNVTRNRIYRARTSGGPYSLIATVSARTTYTTTSVSRNRTYYYVVTAVNAAGQASPRSNEASAAFGKNWPARTRR
jgi:subtilisin family serine protease